MIIDKCTKRIICTHIDKGRKHDFRMFKESKTAFNSNTVTITDSGYQGIKRYHQNSCLPIKSTKKKPINKEQRNHNHQVGSKRVAVEHVIREMKIFKILALPYRNRRKRFGLRVNLIAGFYNFEL